MAKQKIKSARKYVLYGCPIDIVQRYDIQGYIGIMYTNNVGLVCDKNSAIVYTDDKEPGHGTPDDWVKFFKEDYGFNVHPIFLAD